MGMVDGHVAFEKEEDSGWVKTLAGRVRMSMVDGHVALEKEEDSGWEGHGV